MKTTLPWPTSPRARRELGFFAWIGGLGLVLMPLGTYVAGRMTLGGYEGGLWSLLATVYGDAIRLRPGAWLLLLGPYLLFLLLRITTRPLRRRRS